MATICVDGSRRYYYLQTRGQWYVLDNQSTPVGMGAVGVVFKGYNYYTKEPVAIKMVRPEYASIPAIRERAKYEAQLTFLHPNVVRMLGVCEFDNKTGPIYLVSEFVNGFNFDIYCRKSFGVVKTNLRVSQILKQSVKILNALDYIHRAGVIHRDVKPSNIMIGSDNEPKLMDLGIAGCVNSKFLSQNSFIGTALYAAPELINNSVVDHRTDIYAMGVTLFEVLAGYNPFAAETEEQVLENHMLHNLPEDVNIPKKILTVLRRATSKNKADRFDSAHEFAEEIINYAPYPIVISA